MAIVVTFLLLFLAYFCLMAVRPAENVWLLRPFAARSDAEVPARMWLTPILGTLAALGFSVAAVALVWPFLASGTWTLLVLATSLLSLTLFLLNLGVWTLLPLFLDSVILWGVLVQNWQNLLFLTV